VWREQWGSSISTHETQIRKKQKKKKGEELRGEGVSRWKTETSPKNIAKQQIKRAAKWGERGEGGRQEGKP